MTMSSRKKQLPQVLIDSVLCDDLPAMRQALADGADANVRDAEHQETPLMLAQSEAAAVLLLDHGADVHARDSRGATAFIGTRLPLLAQREADIDAQDEEGKTALMRAVETACIDAVQQLLVLGVDVSRQDEDGRTTLSYAEDYGFSAMAELLRAAREKDGCSRA